MKACVTFVTLLCVLLECVGVAYSDDGKESAAAHGPQCRHFMCLVYPT